MGWCHEFGSQIREGCGHPMTAGDTSCSCSTCGVVCTGRFSACSAVWARGPREVTLARPVIARRPTAAAKPAVPKGAPPAPPAPAEVRGAAAPAQPPDDGRSEVLEWLQSAFDGVRGDLTLVIDAVGRQQQALTTLTQSEATTTHLVELAEALPDRVCAVMADVVVDAVAAGAAATAGPSVSAQEMGDELRHVLPGYIGDAVREIVRPGQGAMMNRVDEVAAELRQSLVEVQVSAGELRNEMARLAAFRTALLADQPGLAEAVEAATSRADGRLTALAQKMESLGERPEWQAVRAHLPFHREPAEPSSGP